MRILLCAVLLAACDSSSGSARPDGSSCQVSGVVNGTFRFPGPIPTQHMFGAITEVELWSEDTTGVVEQHLRLSDGALELQIRQGGPASSAVIYDLVSEDQGAPPQGTGGFMRAGDPCISGMLYASLDTGSLDGSYTAIDLGLNPPRP